MNPQPAVAECRVPDVYDWRQDAYGSWQHAIRMMALSIGSVRFSTLPEMYWQERHGVIP
jgi:hypothetical protein